MDFSGLFKRVGQWKANPIFTKYKGNSRRCLLRGRWGRAAGGHMGTAPTPPRRARCGWSGETRPLGGISGIVHLWLQERDAPAASPPVMAASPSVIPASANETPQAAPQPSGPLLSPRKGSDFGVCPFSAAGGMYRMSPAPHPGRWPRGGSRAPRSPARRSAPPPRSPGAGGGRNTGEAKRWAATPPPVGEAARRRCWIRDAPSSSPDPPAPPEGSRRRPGGCSRCHPGARDPPSRPVTRQGHGEEDGPGEGWGALRGPAVGN